MMGNKVISVGLIETIVAVLILLMAMGATAISFTDRLKSTEKSIESNSASIDRMEVSYKEVKGENISTLKSIEGGINKLNVVVARMDERLQGIERSKGL